MAAPASNRDAWCARCYAAAISRLCEGSVIARPGGKAVTAFPPLERGLAADVRKAAQAILESRGPGSAAMHENHARGGAPLRLVA
jgi:hypothetical protein